MKRRAALMIAWITLLTAGLGHAENGQWVRVTVLLEPGAGEMARVEECLVPGGVYSLAEVERRGLAAVDREILDRVDFLVDNVHDVQASMRLATVSLRQYYLRLEPGKTVVLPVIDLNPRLGVVFDPQRFTANNVVFRVQFLEPEGPAGEIEYTGQPITLRLEDADLRDVIAMFSKVTEREILLDDGVSGRVTVDLRQVPWDQAFDLVLRTNGLGTIAEDEAIRVAPLTELSRRRRVRTDATINLPKGPDASATIASRGDDNTPTVVLIVESVDREPPLVAERDGLVHPTKVVLAPPADDAVKSAGRQFAVFRARVSADGSLTGGKVLVAPSEAYAEALGDLLSQWKLRPVFDASGRKQEAVVGYGVRIADRRVLTSLPALERVGVRVRAEPAPAESPDQYVVSAVITDLETGEPVFAPRITARAGESATVSGEFVASNGQPTRLELEVFIDKDWSKVSCSWSVASDGVVVSSHSAEFQL